MYTEYILREIWTEPDRSWGRLKLAVFPGRNSRVQVWHGFKSLTFFSCLQVEPSVLSQLVVDMYECWKTGQKYEPYVKVHRSFKKRNKFSSHFSFILLAWFLALMFQSWYHTVLKVLYWRKQFGVVFSFLPNFAGVPLCLKSERRYSSLKAYLR